MKTTSETGLVIPAAYEKLKITQAYKLMSISRTTFYRNYLDSGLISIHKDAENKSYIPFSELYRVFGELATQKLMVHTNTVPIEQNGDLGTQRDIPNTNGAFLEYHNLKSEKTLLEERIQALNDKLSDREVILKEKNTFIARQERRIETLEGQISHLLEDKSKKNNDNLQSKQSSSPSEEVLQLKQMVQTLTESLQQEQAHRQKPFWARIINLIKL